MDDSEDKDALLHDFDHAEEAREGSVNHSPHVNSKRPASSRQRQDDLSIWQCVQAYRPAIFWSLVVSTCVIMEGYDTILMGTMSLLLDLFNGSPSDVAQAISWPTLLLQSNTVFGARRPSLTRYQQHGKQVWVMLLLQAPFSALFSMAI